MEVTGRADNADVWLTKADKEQRLSPPLTSVNLRDLCSVSDNIKPGMCVRSSQVISQEDAQRLGVRVSGVGAVGHGCFGWSPGANLKTKDR